jgi:hypothetical protein
MTLDPSKVRLFIATPCYGALTHAAYTVSLLATKDALREAGVEHTIRLLPGDSLVPRARGVLTAKFMASDCTHMLFIDGDLYWKPESVLRLLAATSLPDVPVACGVYPRKEIPARFPVNFAIDEDRMLTWHDETRYVEIKDAPTGFLMIRRDAIQALIDAHPERKCSFREDAPADEERWEYDLYPTPIDTDKRYLSEDFGFSRLWQGIGGRIWADTKIHLAHYGQHRFEGSISDLFIDKPRKAQDIEGWMTDEELGFLHAAATTVGSVAEIGSWKGRSTFALLSGCAGPVYAVDHWRGSEGEREGPHAEAVTGDVYAQFRDNVGHFANLRAVMASSVAGASAVPDVDMVFIDGGHTYAEVVADIRTWRPKARRILCGHDHHMPDVARAVADELGAVSVVGSIWIKPL